MNTVELNAAQIGSASTLPGVYIRGALKVYAATVAVFTQTGYQQVYGQALARVAAVGLFGAIIRVNGSSAATVEASFKARGLIKLLGKTTAQASSVAKVSVGTLVKVIGKTAAFAVGSFITIRKTFVNAATNAVAYGTDRFGISRTVSGRTEPTAQVIEAGFTTFGEYAPEARFIIVQQEDRKATVV